MAVNDTSDPEIAALLKRVEEYRRLYDLGDSANFNRQAVEPLYKMDEDFVAYDVAPPVGGYQGWKAYSAGWYKVMDKYAYIRFAYRDDLRVHRLGDVGWSSVSAEWFGRSKAGTEFKKEIRISLVWVRDRGEWRIAHEHASAPQLQALAGGESV